MHRRRRLSAFRSFSMETLERRSMLAADSVEGSFAAEVIDHINEVFQDDVFQDEVFQEIPTADSLLVSGEAEPMTEPEEPFIGMNFGPDDKQALEASFSLLVCPPVLEFETTGLIAVEPDVSVDPVLALDVTTGVSHLQFIDGDIVKNLTLVESGLYLTSEVVDLSKNLGMDADTITVVDDRSIFWCGFGFATDSGNVDTLAAPVESPAADSTSDDEAPVVTSRSGGSSPSTATSAATAQAFAAFAASFGQSSSDVQPGLTFFGGRRTARR